MEDGEGELVPTVDFETETWLVIFSELDNVMEYR